MDLYSDNVIAPGFRESWLGLPQPKKSNAKPMLVIPEKKYDEEGELVEVIYPDFWTIEEILEYSARLEA